MNKSFSISEIIALLAFFVLACIGFMCIYKSFNHQITINDTFKVDSFDNLVEEALNDLVIIIKEEGLEKEESWNIPGFPLKYRTINDKYYVPAYYNGTDSIFAFIFVFEDDSQSTVGVAMIPSTGSKIYALNSGSFQVGHTFVSSKGNVYVVVEKDDNYIVVDQPFKSLDIVNPVLSITGNIIHIEKKDIKR